VAWRRPLRLGRRSRRPSRPRQARPGRARSPDRLPGSPARPEAAGLAPEAALVSLVPQEVLGVFSSVISLEPVKHHSI